VAIGERLFLETRFAEFFARSSPDDVNAPLAAGDPVLSETLTTGASLPGPFAGGSIHCRACHLVDEQLAAPGGGMRTYADFARRSPLPARGDGRAVAARNSPPLVNASLAREGGLLLHFDGEFASLEALIRDTLGGRNYGWLPGERARAFAQIARVVREDDGQGALAQEFGGAYARVLAGTDPELPAELRLPEAYRIDVRTASERELVDAVASLIAAYVRNLVFLQDEAGRFGGSPYDLFLERNALPRAPAPGERDEAYTARLRAALAALQRPQFVSEGRFAFHDREFRFGPQELAGLRIFLRERPRAGERSGVGNCAACHPAPAFTDFSFHNTGVTQDEYDAAHGAGAFRALEIPGLRERNAQPERFLPATERHPAAAEPFRRPASATAPGHTDLGVWNVLGNPDFPLPQRPLLEVLCRERVEEALAQRPVASARGLAHGLCLPSRLLGDAIARFKTPGLRDLSHGAPFFHNGAFDALEDVVEFYRRSATAARRRELRNADPELVSIALAPADVAPLAAFLRALDEDYE
jgi:cytochrome c peroxidase